MVSEIMAIEVSAVATILDFSKHLKIAKMGFCAIAYCTWGRNRAPFRSTIDGFRDIANRSFGRVIIGDFHDERLKMAFGQLHMPLGSKSSSVSLYDRWFPT